MSDLTGKQRMVLDYMRGNGCILTTRGRGHLCTRGSFSSRGISQVIAVLRREGYLQTTSPPFDWHDGIRTLATLTEKGKRA